MSTANVEDIYELSPLQQGMLLHSLYDGSTDMYVSQHTQTADGPLDPDALERAWQLAVEAHSALRTSFYWEGLAKPLQVVHRDVSVPVFRHDWSQLEESEQKERLDRLRADDSAAGFDLTVAPLQRLHVIRLGERRHSLIWTYHHVLMDGWSIQLFLNDVAAHYRWLAGGPPPPPAAPPFRDYIAWLQKQDLAAAQRFWVEALAGMRPSRLTAMKPWDPQRGTGAVDRRIVSLPESSAAGLRATAARHRVTFGTLVQAAWAIALRHYTTQDEVTFGCASSGRPVELPQVDRMIGVFANTLPQRVRVPDDGELGPWLREMQGSYAAIRRYEYAPLADIKKWAGAPGQQLFDNLLVLENYPTAIGTGDGAEEQLTFRRHALYDKINLPLTVTVSTGPAPEMHVLTHRERFDPDFVDELLRRLNATFAAISTAERIAEVVSAAGPVPTAVATHDGPVAVAGGAPTAPANDAEEAIAAIYRDVLGIADVDVTLSFFELGGDSFDAVRAVSRLDGATIGMLAAHPSVRALASALRHPDGGGLLRRLTGSGTPSHTLVCVPVGGGSAISYQPLADALSPDIGVLAISLPGHELGAEPETRPLDDIAQECVRELLDGADGPLSVYGHSAGVALAVELTRLLEAAGRPVTMLFLAASYPFYEGGFVARALNRRRENPAALQAEVRQLLSADGMDAPDGLDFVARAASDDLAAGRRYFSERWARGTTPPLVAPITFIAGTDDPAMRRFERRYREWERFGSEVRLATIPSGGHYFHQRQPDVLARTVKRSLSSVDSVAGRRAVAWSDR